MSAWLLRRIPTLVTIVIGTGAAVLATAATSDVAATRGSVDDPRLAWILPVVIEGGALGAGVLAWERTGAGKSAVPERLALLVLTVIATVTNALHAAGDLWGMVLAMCAPLVLITFVELRLRSIAPPSSSRTGQRDARDRDPSAPTLTAAAITDERAIIGGDHGLGGRDQVLTVHAHSPDHGIRTDDERSVIASTRTALHSVPENDEGEPVPAGPERDAIVDRLLAENPAVNGTQVAERLGLKPPSGRRELGKAKQRARARRSA